MHFLAIALVERDKGRPADRLAAQMAPHFVPDLGVRRGRCDGYVPGGRWDGLLDDPRILSADRAATRPDDGAPPSRMRPLREIVDRVALLAEASALITPAGAWIARDLAESPAAWIATASRVLDEHADCFVVPLDCHR